jgi:hypothetical protein
MTQSPQFNYYQPASSHADPLAASRRASVLLFILGVLLAGFGLCNILSTANLSTQELQEAQTRFLPKEQPPPFKLETIKTVSVVMQGAIVLIGLILLALGVPVRNGSFPATIGAAVVSGIVLMLLIVLTLIMLIATLATPVAGAFACVMIVPLVGFAMAVLWLVQAARALGSNRTTAQQYAANYWQYYQQQAGQAYGPYAPPGTMPQYPPQYMPPAAPGSQSPPAPQPPAAPPENPYGTPPPQ